MFSRDLKFSVNSMISLFVFLCHCPCVRCWMFSLVLFLSYCGCYRSKNEWASIAGNIALEFFTIYAEILFHVFEKSPYTYPPFSPDPRSPLLSLMFFVYLCFLFSPSNWEEINFICILLLIVGGALTLKKPIENLTTKTSSNFVLPKLFHSQNYFRNTSHLRQQLFIVW